MLVAITREVSSNIGRCELTHLIRDEIDIDRARAQHRQYERCLVDLGLKVISLPEETELPDSVFVEDTAIIIKELAIITRPGAVSRRSETKSIAKALKPHRRLVYIKSPGTIDGGDALCVGKTLFVCLSRRSNQAGIEQLRAILAPFDYRVKGVQISNCLHLKSAVTQVGRETLLVNSAWVETDAFGRMNFIHVDQSEPCGGNALLIGKTVIYPRAYPATRRQLEDHGIEVKVVDISELAKAEGGVTCCSLIFDMG